MKTQIALARRYTTLRTLRSSGVLFLWHPLLVDAALDQPKEFDRLETLVFDPSFIDAVGRITRRAPSLGELLGDETPQQLLDRSRFLAEPFLTTMRRKVLARMKLSITTNRLLADEIEEQLRFEFLRMADRFVPGAVDANGSVRTFGFKAFLEKQLPFKLRDIVRRCVSDFGRHDHSAEMDRHVEGTSCPDFSADMTQVIRRAFHRAMRSRRDAQLLEAFIRKNGDLAEFARRDGCSSGKIRRDLETIFSRVAASLPEEGRVMKTPRLLYCRQALQDMVPTVDFSAWLSHRSDSQ